jgi:protocatechuate 3,4-dioxygenase beta subunit
VRAIALAVLVVTGLVLATGSAAAATPGCRPTPSDSFGPFGRGSPPLRSSIGSGHVLTGVVLSALDCKPLARARVELWQAGRNGRYTRATSATVLTDAAGRFRFQGPPPGRYSSEPHIHLRVVAPVHEILLARYVVRGASRRGVVRLVLTPQAL